MTDTNPKPYTSIADAVAVTGNEAYAPGDVEVYYMRPELFHKLINGPYACVKGDVASPTLATLDATHIKLGTISERSIGKAWCDLQGDFWSPMGQANGLLDAKGLRHTSMSVGDVFVIDGRIIMVDGCGFAEVVDGRWVKVKDDLTPEDNQPAWLNGD